MAKGGASLGVNLRVHTPDRQPDLITVALAAVTWADSGEITLYHADDTTLASVHHPMLTGRL